MLRTYVLILHTSVPNEESHMYSLQGGDRKNGRRWVKECNGGIRKKKSATKGTRLGIQKQFQLKSATWHLHTYIRPSFVARVRWEPL